MPAPPEPVAVLSVSYPERIRVVSTLNILVLCMNGLSQGTGGGGGGRMERVYRNHNWLSVRAISVNQPIRVLNLFYIFKDKEAYELPKKDLE